MILNKDRAWLPTLELILAHVDGNGWIMCCGEKNQSTCPVCFYRDKATCGGKEEDHVAGLWWLRYLAAMETNGWEVCVAEKSEPDQAPAARPGLRAEKVLLYLVVRA